MNFFFIKLELSISVHGGQIERSTSEMAGDGRFSPSKGGRWYVNQSLIGSYPYILYYNALMILKLHQGWLETLFTQTKT